MVRHSSWKLIGLELGRGRRLFTMVLKQVGYITIFDGLQRDHCHQSCALVTAIPRSRHSNTWASRGHQAPVGLPSRQRFLEERLDTVEVKVLGRDGCNKFQEVVLAANVHHLYPSPSHTLVTSSLCMLAVECLSFESRARHYQLQHPLHEAPSSPTTKPPPKHYGIRSASLGSVISTSLSALSITHPITHPITHASLFARYVHCFQRSRISWFVGSPAPS